MHVVEPKSYFIADSAVPGEGMDGYLQAIGAGFWLTPDVGSDGELLVEIAGRTCYKSFGLDLNANLTKVRTDHQDYIGNILKTKHGSVLEHATTTMGLVNISRILTHELVRHRAGCAYSQESMRFVRLEDIGMWIPSCIKEDETAEALFKTAVTNAEKSYLALVDCLIKDGMPMGKKKEITSAIRRIAPSGHATTIVMTANHRAWRHLIELRTAEGAEEEIRLVFHDIACQFAQRYPAFYQDMQYDEGDYLTPVIFKNSKI